MHFLKLDMSEVKSVKEAGNIFAINLRARKTDLLVMRLTDTTEILHVEVSGPPYKPEKKHTVGDVKKLLMMAVCKYWRTISIVQSTLPRKSGHIVYKQLEIN